MLDDPVRRDRLLISASILTIIALAWAYLIHLDATMSASMEHDRMMAEMGMAMDMRWTRADALFTFVMWTVMMVGMMSGAAFPVLLLFASAAAKRRSGGAAGAALVFGFGYFAVWAGFSALAALAQWLLHDRALLSPSMATSSSRTAGIILMAAGVYQLTTWKAACLTHCRSPLAFLMSHWRDGFAGAFDMGLRHGVYCLGCCWALMCVLFAVGVMNLLWVAALSVIVLIEKMFPAGQLVSRVAGAALILYGAVVAIHA